MPTYVLYSLDAYNEGGDSFFADLGAIVYFAMQLSSGGKDRNKYKSKEDRTVVTRPYIALELGLQEAVHEMMSIDGLFNDDASEATKAKVKAAATKIWAALKGPNTMEE